MALARPRRAARRRKNAPSVLLRHCQFCAAHRKACAARGTPGRGALACPGPPDFVGCGAPPRPLPQCFALGHRLMAVPISLTPTSAVLSSLPSMALRPTPALGGSRCRAAHVPSLALRRRPRRVGASGGPAGNASSYRWALMTRAQAWLCAWSESYKARDGCQANPCAGCPVPCRARGITAPLA